MRKKRVIMASTVLAAACLSSACAGKTAQQVAAREQYQNESSQEESNQMKNRNKNTAAQTESASIDSYESVQKFGYELFGQNLSDKNPVLSPVSAYLALAMAGCGADGTTRDEFYSVLGSDMLPLSGDMMNTLPAQGKLLNLSIADSAWIDNTFLVDDTWLGTIQSLMHAEAFTADLSAAPTMDQINDWIEDKTNGLIPQMLTEPLDARTKLVLFNTVYFKGRWQTPFMASNTHKEEFYTHGKEEIQLVDMMNLTAAELDYIANDFVEGVILPYQPNSKNGGNLAFVALKPTGDEEIRTIYNALTSEVLADILVNRKTELVNLKLPKFEMTFDKNLNESLANMGLRDCFDAGKANFDQIGQAQSGENLYIDLVRQKAKIIVDEEGTEAAAVTEVAMRCMGLMPDPDGVKEVYFNEPFLYMILDMDRELPLFVGILDNPVL